MCNEVFKYKVGERRIITSTARSEFAGETVVITSANFELIEKFKKNVVQSGNCEIAGDKARVFLDFTNVSAGNYELSVTTAIGWERITESCDIELVE